MVCRLVERQQTNAYLKCYFPGFPLEWIETDIDMRQLHIKFHNDPEVHAVLLEIEMHFSWLLNYLEVILPDGTLLSERRRAGYEMDEEDDNDADYNFDPDFVPDEDWSTMEDDKVLDDIEEPDWDIFFEVVDDISKELARKLNAAIRPLLNAEIVTLVFQLRQEIFEQERREKLRREKWDQERCARLKSKAKLKRDLSAQFDH